MNGLLLAVSLIIVAAALRPVSTLAQRLAVHLVPEDPDSAAALASFSRHVARLRASDEGLTELARLISVAVDVPAAQITVGDGESQRSLTWPDEANDPWPTSVAVTQGGRQLGTISIGALDEDAITRRSDLLHEVAHRSASFFQTVALVDALQRQVTQLEHQAIELRDARRRIVVAADQERRRLERNLHDGAQQQLTALVMQLGVAAAVAERAPDRLPFLVAELAVSAEDISDAVADLAQGADPRLLRQKGLASALLVHASRLPVAVDVAIHDVGRHEPDVEAAVYYSCLEAVQNALKHGRPHRIRMELQRSGNGLAFRIADDGTGFDPTATAPAGGLQNLTDRIEAMGGGLEVTSSVGVGTTVAGRVPVGSRVGGPV